MKILVTGGAGYIGSHTIIELINQGFTDILSIDNYINSKEDVYDRIKEISGVSIDYFDIDMTDAKKLDLFFEKHQIDAVIHFAALKSVPESVDYPENYYRNNILSLLNLLNSMKELDKIIHHRNQSVYSAILETN